MRWVAILTCLFFLQSNAQEQPLCYELSHDELGISGSYLFGTMHVMEANRFFFPKKLSRLLQKSDALCLEIKSITNVHIDPDIMFDSTLNLKAYCDSTEWSELTLWAEDKLYMKPKQFEENFKFAKPFMLFQFILAMSLPVNKKSHEQELEKIAAANKIQFLGLESVHEQLNIFNQIPFDDQMDMVFNELNEGEKNKQDFNDMQQAYIEQDLATLCDFSSDKTFVGYKALFLDNRNKKWMPKMKEMMLEEKVFFAVGAGHLCGENGLIALLKKEGFTIKPIEL
ncbi:MAG: hypothetical protein CL857_05090 [Cryomorphaceae bacterium]|nr:hypothetical protein [Cryomorphaceae bacterium]